MKIVTQIKVQVHLKEHDPWVKRKAVSSSSVRKYTERPDHIVEHPGKIHVVMLKTEG